LLSRSLNILFRNLYFMNLIFKDYVHIEH
jgi:hypothetical protein